MVISREREAEILRYYHVERWRVGTIARQIGVHHNVVKRVLAQAGLCRVSASPVRRSLIRSCRSSIRHSRSSLH